MNPSAGPAGGGQPPSFKTNVNRAKTKRWVEAKSYSYDGDDWGEADEYDEYGGYADPGPAQKATALQTGFRQPGQTASSTGGIQGRQDIHQSPSSYGEQQYIAPGGRVSQLHDDQSAMGRQPYRQSGDGRASSFNQGQDQRTYSMGSSYYGVHAAGPPSHAPSQQNYGQQQGPPQMRGPGPGQIVYHQPNQERSRQSLDGQSRAMGTGPPAANYRGVSYSDRQRLSREGSRSQSMTSSTSSTDFHSRRDFSPSAMPPPLHTQPRDHPPRKSSLSQDEAPRISGGPFLSSTSANPYPPESSEALVSSPVESSSNTESASKPLPFVRPADIYKRLAEEREKERQSQESSRPSMDALLGSKAGSARDESPSSTGLRPGSNNMRAVPVRKPSFESGDDSEGGRRQKTSLDPVPERRSEYGMDGFTADLAPLKNEAVVQSDSQLPETVKTTSSSNEKPRLPPVPRMSGFGESFLGPMGDTYINKPDAEVETPKATGNSQDVAHLSPQTTHDISLQHQPSLGFRSVVNKAFEDQIPPTPSSTAGSAVARSNSESTNGISPIISRAPSAVTSDARARDTETRDHGISIIPEEPKTNAPRRPDSGDTVVTLKATARKASPPQNSLPESSGSISTPVISSHRWSVNAPSPDNSPARTPALETNLQPPQPQEAELAMTTPTSMTHSSSSASNMLPAVPAERSDRSSQAAVMPVTGGQDAPHALHTSAPAVADSVDESRSKAHAGSSTPPQAMAPSVSRAESPSKGRVRDLADKFDSQNVSRKGSESSLKGSVHSATMGKPDEYNSSRPPTDRMESFRPHLPGGWESFASSAPAPVPAQPSVTATRRSLLGTQTPDVDSENSKSPLNQTISRLGPSRLGNGESKSNSSKDVPSEGTERTAAKHERVPSSASERYSLSDPFSAVAAAGTALAGALIAAVGIDQTESESHGDPAHETRNMRDTSAGRGRAASIQNRDIHPETMQPQMPTEDDSASSAAPTPLAVDSGDQVDENDNPNYFPPIVPLKQKPREIQTSDESLPYTRPPILPTLSTETSPNDYESDRLRKQLVRELSPHTERFPEDQTGERDPSQVNDTRSSDKMNRHESIYDSYWNEPSSGEDTDRGLSHQDPVASTAPDISKDMVASEAQLPPSVEVQHSITPAGPEPVPEANRSESLQVRPAQLTHRFSWEPVPEEINGPSHDTSTLDTTPIPESKPAQHMDFHSGFLQPSEAYQPSDGNPQLAKQLPDEPIHSDVSAAQPTPHAPQQQIDDSAHLSRSAPAEPAMQDIPLPPLPNEQPRIPAFREILVLKTPAERIHAYKETREQFANMNTGLDHWILATLNDLPEHGELTKNGATFGNISGHRPSPSRGNFPGLRVVSGQSQPQPYYQQYLNASTQAVSSSPSTPGSANATRSPTYSPANQGGRNSGHQMQAKGKDLLHTAGVFGGKANVAAKGLFSKGKSKFRGSGGADKATPRISSAPNTDATRGMQQQYPPSPKLHTQDPPLPRSLDCVDNDAPSTDSLIKSISQNFTDGAVLSSSNDGPQESTQNSLVSTSDAIVRLTDHSTGRASVISGGLNSSGHPRDPSTVVNDHLVRSSHVDPPAAAHGSGGSPQSISAEVFPSPKSQSSSNRTPKQADFGPNGLNSELPPPASPLPPFGTTTPSGSSDKGNTTIDTFSQSIPIYGHEGARDQVSQATDLSRGAEEDISFLPQDKVISTPLQDVQHSKDSQRPFITTPRTSEDSGATFQTAHSGEEFQMRQQTGRAVIIPPRALPQPVRAIAVRTSIRRARNNTEANPSISTSQPTSGTNTTTPGGEYRNASRPFSFISFGQVPVGDLTLRGPSLDSGRGRLYKDLPLTPASSEQSVTKSQSRVAPIQKDTNHDSTSQSGQSSGKPRGQSFSRPIHDPHLQEHRPFRQENPEIDDSNLPSNHYPPQARRGEAIIPQGTEYRLDGIGPPAAEQINKSGARRSSRGSAFFKRLSIPSAPDVPSLPLPHDRVAPPAESPSKLPISQKRKGKRVSLFRSLTGRSGSDSGHSPSVPAAQPAGPQTDQYMDTIPTQQGQYPSPTGQSINQGSPGGPALRASGKKLQRSSTSGVPEQEKGKKKRFSSLGTFFGRMSPKQQSNFIPAPQPKRSSQQQSQQPQTPFDELRTTDERQRMGPTNPIAQGSAYQTNHQEYYQPAHPLGYYRPPLEGYYSPNNEESIYPLGHVNGQPPPTDYRQPQTQPHAALDETSASPSPPGNLQSYSTQNNSWEVSDSYGNHLKTNGLTSINTSPQYQNYGRSGPILQGRYQGHSNRSFSANPDAAYVDTIMRDPQGYHETPTGRGSPPTPPPPPPKDDYLQKSPRSRAISHTRSSSQDAQFKQETPSPSPRGPSQTRQSLPPLQTGATQVKASSGKPTTPEDVRKARQRQLEEAGPAPPTPTQTHGQMGSRLSNDAEEKIVMSSTSYPGQEWQPSYGNWDGD